MYVDGYLGTPFRQHQVHAGTTHHVAQGALGSMLQGALRIAHSQYKLFRIVDDILRRQFHLDDILILGQHDFAQAGGSDLGGIHPGDIIDKWRIPLQARLHDFMVFTQAQHHAPLLLIYLVEAHQPPNQQGTGCQHAQ